MSRWRRLGRAVERFRQRTIAAAEEAAKGQQAIHCQACEAWIPRRLDRCPECDRVSPRAVLGVAPDAPEDAVRTAAREKLKATHPDQGGSRDAFERVKDARDRLLR